MKNKFMVCNNNELLSVTTIGIATAAFQSTIKNAGTRHEKDTSVNDKPRIMTEETTAAR